MCRCGTSGHGLAGMVVFTVGHDDLRSFFQP